MVAAAAALGVLMIADWCCGGPVNRALSLLPRPIVLCAGLVFVALTMANLMVAAVLVIVFVMVLPIHLWRLAEVISGFVLRHLLPRRCINKMLQNHCRTRRFCAEVCISLHY